MARKTISFYSKFLQLYITRDIYYEKVGHILRDIKQ